MYLICTPHICIHDMSRTSLFNKKKHSTSLDMLSIKPIFLDYNTSAVQKRPLKQM